MIVKMTRKHKMETESVIKKKKKKAQTKYYQSTALKSSSGSCDMTQEV